MIRLETPPESKDTPKITVFMAVSGDAFDFADCTRAIGLQPTGTGTKRIDHPSLPEAEWSIEFSRLRLHNTDEAISVLLDHVYPNRPRIVTFAQDHALDISFGCNVTITGTRPIYHFSAETIRKIAEFHGDLGLDIFDYSERELPVQEGRETAKEILPEDRNSPKTSVGMIVRGGGAFDADEFTRMSGIDPTEIRRGSAGAEDNGAKVEWILSIINLRDYSTDDAVRVLLDRVYDRSEEIVQHARDKRLAILFTCEIVVNVDRPIYELSAESVRRISDFEADFDMGVYDYADDPEITLDDGTTLQRLI